MRRRGLLGILLALALAGCSRPQATPAASDAPSIPGMKSGPLQTNLENLGLKCVGPNSSDAGVTWVCRGSKGAARYTVTMNGASPTSIREVSAGVFQDTPDDAAAATFLGFIASVPYDGARPDDARAWVQSELGKAETTRKAFGGAMYILIGPPDSRSLTITPTTVP